MLYFLLVFILQISFAYCHSGDGDGDGDGDSHGKHFEIYEITSIVIGSFVFGLFLGCISGMCIACCVCRSVGVGHKVQLSLQHDPENATMTVDNSVHSSPVSTVIRYVRNNNGSNKNDDSLDVSSSFAVDLDVPAPRKPLPPPVSVKPSKAPVLHQESDSSDDISEYDLPIPKAKSLQRGLVSVGILNQVQPGNSNVRRSFSLNELKTFGLPNEDRLENSEKRYRANSPESEHYYTAEIPKPSHLYMNIGSRKAE